MAQTRKQVAGNEITLISSARGINNAQEPFRLKAFGDEGTAQVLATNVDIDTTGGIARRDGYELVLPLVAPHSLFAAPSALLLIDSSNMYSFNGESLVVVASGFTKNLRMFYVQVGDRIYYSNGSESGFLDNSLTLHAWEYIQQERPESSRVYTAPPPGKFLTLFNGRIYFSKNNFLFFTEHLAYHSFCAATNFLAFSSTIIDILAVDNGIYASTENEIYFLSGATVRDFEMKRVSLIPLISGTACQLDPSTLGEAASRFFPGPAYVACTPFGVMLLGHSGYIENITLGTYAVEGEIGAACVLGKGKGNNRYIATTL